MFKFLEEVQELLIGEQPQGRISRQTYLVLFLLASFCIAPFFLPLSPLYIDALVAMNFAVSLFFFTASFCTQIGSYSRLYASILLVSVFFRLSLNVTISRGILLHGYAGSIVSSFGDFLISNTNLVIGTLIFAFLSCLNFYVIFEGAKRIGQLFPNDSSRIGGVMKLMRGEAIVVVVVPFINFFGRLLVGNLVHGIDVVAALPIYLPLAIGSGLVSQIPSLLLLLSTSFAFSPSESQ